MEPLELTDLVFVHGRRLYTKSIDPGSRVYGERLFTSDDAEFREWDPSRSKLSAYIQCGGRAFPFGKGSKVLYLGAASGTTASHVSDIASDGKVYCVEYSERSFRDLVRNAAGRGNMIPILGDARQPDGYGFVVEDVDIVYADVAQKGQADILVNNMERFCARYGFLCVKARSEDVTADPRDIFAWTERRLRERACRILDVIDIGDYERDHEMIVVERRRVVYCVGFRDGRYLMNFNPKRGGWEMPGGKLEEGETSEEAARREFLEETGYDVEVVGTLNIGYCDVCACNVLGRISEEAEMETRLFDELPDDLSFDRSEYEYVISWARKAVGHDRKGDDQDCVPPQVHSGSDAMSHDR